MSSPALIIVRSIVAAFGALLLAVAPAAAQVAQPDATAITHHRIAVDGKPLDYTAEAGRIAIRDAETGEPHGYMFYVAYRRPGGARARPITFVWNGGPGANASILHLQAAGPRRFEGGRLVDNQETWLTDTDLVFVDPIGTGFSQPAKADYGAEFYNTVGDVMSVAAFVRSWRLLHRAEDTPLYLAGESWGGGRAASVAYALLKRGVKVDGMILISGGTGLRMPGEHSTLNQALHVVDLAATALYHGKTDPALGKDLPAVQAAADAWARTVYAPALANPAALSAADKAQVVARLSAFTGLPASRINPATLGFTPRQYLTGLLADQGKTLNVFDMRVTGKVDEGDPAVASYLRGELGYTTDQAYVGNEAFDDGYIPNGKAPEEVGSRWVYATIPVTPEALNAAKAEASQRGGGPPSIGPPLPGTAEALVLNPRLKVLVAAGQYDSLNSCTANTELAKRLDPALKAAIGFHCYVGGHMVYRDPASRVQLSRDIRAMVSAR